MTDRLKPFTKAWHDRQLRHNHNSFHGHANMMKANCNSIVSSITATDEAKVIAYKIYNLAIELDIALKVRRK